MKTATFAAATLSLLASTLIPTQAQNTTLPFAECLLPCDTLALQTVGCTASDLLCHCEKATQTFEILVPCVLSNSTCGANATADLLSFGSFAAGTCVPYNITPPAISDFFPNATSGTNTTNGTNTTISATPTPSLYTSGAGAMVGSVGGWAVIVGAVGLALTV